MRQKKSAIPVATWRAAARFAAMADAIRSGEYDPTEDMEDARFRVDYRFGYAPRVEWRRVRTYERRMFSTCTR